VIFGQLILLIALQIQGLQKGSRCVNVGKPLRHSWTPRQKSDNGAVWIPTQLLEIVPYQRMSSQLPPTLTTQMIEVALRPPADHARLIVEEGLDVLQIGPTTTQTAANNNGCDQPTPAMTIVSAAPA
jgi:hypothetical protein